MEATCHESLPLLHAFSIGKFFANECLVMWGGDDITCFMGLFKCDLNLETIGLLFDDVEDATILAFCGFVWLCVPETFLFSKVMQAS